MQIKNYKLSPCDNAFLPFGLNGKAIINRGYFIYNKMIRTKFNATHKAGIYQIQSNINNKIYIGSTANLKLRKKTHFGNLKRNKHPNKHLQHHANKYGINDLVFKLIETCSEKIIIEREQYYIDTLKPEFNIRKIAGAAQFGKHNAMYNIHRCGKDAPAFGKHWKLSEETKQNMKDAHPNVFGKNNPMFGKHHSEKTKQKIGATKQGNKNYLFGKKHTKETIEKMSISAKKRKRKPYGKKYLYLTNK